MSLKVESWVYKIRENYWNRDILLLMTKSILFHFSDTKSEKKTQKKVEKTDIAYRMSRF